MAQLDYGYKLLLKHRENQVAQQGGGFSWHGYILVAAGTRSGFLRCPGPGEGSSLPDIMTEQQPYTVLGRYPGFELRHYPRHVLAQVTVNGGFEGAGNTGFRLLYAYISGSNTARTALEPYPAGEMRFAETLAMTAPVLLEPSPIAGAFTVAFVLPADLTALSAPVPEDPAVSIVAVPGQAGAAAAFSGRWSEANYQGHLAALQAAVRAQGFSTLGNPRFARFDPPYRPWFLRRNEVVQDVEGPGD